MSRTIEIEIGALAGPGRSPSTTVVPFGPRILATRRRRCRPGADPSIDTIRSPGRTPALSAGAPWITLETTRVQVVLEGRARRVVLVEVAGITAPIPLNVPARPSRAFWKSLGLRYWLNGSPSASIMPLIAPSTSVWRLTGSRA